MQNTSRINLKKFECRLVNSFGDGHNHELAQYEALSQFLSKVAAVKGIDGILLGNVVCDNVSLDSLLLTSFGVFIIEFKSYPEVARVSITGQKEFRCLNADRSRMKKSDGSFLNVKGGSLDSPYDQAKKNRIAVFNTLKRVFGEERAKNIHVGVSIVFNGKTVVEGIDKIIEAERRWLTVVNSVGFEQFISYAAEENARGLADLEREALISHMDADSNVIQKADAFQQANEYFRMGKYREAYERAALCDPYNPKVVCLKLHALYHYQNKKYSSIFDKIVVDHINNNHPLIHETSNMLLGLSFYYGINGHEKNDERALLYLKQSGSLSNEVVDAIRAIEEKKCLAQKRKEEDEKNQRAWELARRRKESYQDSCSMAISCAESDYSDAGRLVLTFLVMIAAIFLITIFIPNIKEKWMWAIGVCILAICGILKWVYEDCSVDSWFILKNPRPHVSSLPFRTLVLRSKSFSEGDRLYKTIFHIALSLLYFALPMFLCYRLVKIAIDYLMTVDGISKLVGKICLSSTFDPAFWLHAFLLSYFLLSFGAIAFVVATRLFRVNNPFYAEHDEKGKCYLTAVPDIKADLLTFKDASIVGICKEGLVFSAGMTIALCILGAVKPYLFAAISFLF